MDIFSDANLWYVFSLLKCVFNFFVFYFKTFKSSISCPAQSLQALLSAQVSAASYVTLQNFQKCTEQWSHYMGNAHSPPHLITESCMAPSPTSALCGKACARSDGKWLVLSVNLVGGDALLFTWNKYFSLWFPRSSLVCWCYFCTLF